MGAPRRCFQLRRAREHILPGEPGIQPELNLVLLEVRHRHGIGHREQKLTFVGTARIHNDRGELVPLHELCFLYVAVQRQEHIALHGLLRELEQSVHKLAGMVGLVPAPPQAAYADEHIRALAGHHLSAQGRHICVPIFAAFGREFQLYVLRPAELCYNVLKAGICDCAAI